MSRVFIGLGSNLGDRMYYLRHALRDLEIVPHTMLKKCSSVYETDPVGVKDQPQFLNMVAELDSTLLPHDLLRKLKEIEYTTGRVHRERWGPREIDLDLLCYDDKVLNDEQLQLPHPEIAHRRFVLVPLEEIAREFIIPLQCLCVGELLLHCKDSSAVRKISLPIDVQERE